MGLGLGLGIGGKITMTYDIVQSLLLLLYMSCASVVVAPP